MSTVPVEADDGSVTMRREFETFWKAAEVLPNMTPVVPKRLLPCTVTAKPPEVGPNRCTSPVIVGVVDVAPARPAPPGSPSITRPTTLRAHVATTMSRFFTSASWSWTHCRGRDSHRLHSSLAASKLLSYGTCCGSYGAGVRGTFLARRS